MNPRTTPISPTMNLSEVSQRPWDVVVIGAGPAGSVVARYCASHGARVLLVDRCHFPRYKVCGCCLNGRAVHIIHELGLGSVLTGAVALETLELACRQRRASIGLPGGVVLSRERLDMALVEAAIAGGATFLSGVTASCGPLEGAGRTVILRQGDHKAAVHASRVVAAGGVGDRQAMKSSAIAHRPGWRSKVGAGAILSEPSHYFRPGVIYMSVGRGGYVGMTRLEDGRLELAAALDAKHLARYGDASAMAIQIIRDAGQFPTVGLDQLRWVGTGRLTFHTNRVARSHLYLLGDACGYVEPFTGEGIAWALEGAKLLGELLTRGQTTPEETTETAWCDLHRRSIRPRQRVCRLLRLGMRGHWRAAIAVRLLSIMPALAKPIVQAIHVPVRRRGLAQIQTRA